MSDDQKRSVRARFLSNPFELTLAVVFSLVGAGLVLSGFHLYVTRLQVELPMVLVAAWALALLLCGPLIVTGVFWSGSPTIGRAVERAGLYLAASAWGTYGITLATIGVSPALTSVLMALVFSVGCTVRAYALGRVDKAVQQLVQADDRGRC